MSARAGAIRLWHFVVVAGLLALPCLAVKRRFGWGGTGWFLAWTAGISAVTYFFYALDKRQAREKAWRESEKSLHILELIGGWPGAFLAQRWLRHKSAKGNYQFVFAIIVAAYQAAAIWVLGR